LAALSSIVRSNRCLTIGGLLGWAFLNVAKFSYGKQQLTPMTKRRYANLFEVLISEMRQDGKANIVLDKALCVLPETELL
jgi:hypothetical protein